MDVMDVENLYNFSGICVKYYIGRFVFYVVFVLSYGGWCKEWVCVGKKYYMRFNLCFWKVF